MREDLGLPLRLSVSLLSAQNHHLVEKNKRRTSSTSFPWYYYYYYFFLLLSEVLVSAASLQSSVMVNPSSSSSSLSTSSSTAASKGAASSVAPHNPPRSLSREEEIELVRSGLRAQPKDSQRWHPIVYEWFLRWKDFVDFDNNNSHSHSHSPQEVTTTVAAGLPPAPGPGPIDNSSLSLSADHPTELRPGLGEGQDIILLPLSTASYLFQKYGGGPMTFSRGVLSLGPHHHQINLYPVRVEAYLCDSVETCYPMKSKEVQGHYLKAYFNKTFTMDKVVEELTQKFSVPVWYKLRYWLRRPGQGPSVAAGGGGGGSATSVLESKASESSQMDTVDDTDSVDDSKKAVVAVAAGGGGGGGGVRYLRKEVVEWDGDWKLFYSEDQAILRQTLAELLEESASGGGGGVEVIVEAAKRTSYSLEGTPWPRDKVLNRWKTLLRVGDVLDVQDKAKKWYEGRVVSTTSEGDLVVHFLAWEKDFDEKLLAHTLYQRCRPLHSETEDRWTWKEGSQVEVCCQPKKVAGGGGAAVAGGGKCHWVAGVVKKVEGERLAVEFTPPKGFTCRSSTSEEVVEQQEEEESVMVTEEEVAVGGGGEEEDDDKRKLRGVIPSTSTTSVESKVVTCWFDRYQEDICAHHVHLPAYRSNTRTPTASSYLSSSYITPSSSSTTSPLTTTTTTGVGRYSSSSYTSSYTSSYSSYSYDSHSRGQPPAPGVVGLANLGNTCFLNSILQCLSHTAVLTNYFLSSSSSYLQEINYNNPLGHNGKLVLAYRQVLADLWSNHYLKVVPRDFKSTLGQFQPQFAGYDQQDAQELLGFLLDGLHEDLNRVTSKPYVSQLESKNRSDEVVARECWRRYLSRNDSFLVDHLFGLLKSHVTCTKCGRQSVTFDAYNVLSLPLPIRQTRKVTILMQLLLAKPFSSSTTSAITTSTSTTRTPSNTTEVEVKWVKMELEVDLCAIMSQMKELLLDRIKELGYLPALLPVQRPSVAAVGGGGGEDSSYEMVSPPTSSHLTGDEDDGEEEEGYDMVTPPPAPPATAPPPPATTTSTSTSLNYDNYSFHFALAYSSRLTSVCKNFNSRDSGRVAVATYVGSSRMEVLLAFHLAQPLPDYPTHSYASSSTTSYYSAYGSSSSSSSSYQRSATTTSVVAGTAAGGGKKEQEEEEVVGIDVIFAQPSAVGDNRIESLGIIHRLAFTRAQVATVSKLHRAIRSLLLLPLLHHYNSTTSATSSTSLLPPVTLSTAEKDLSRYYTLRTSTNNYSAVLGPVLEQQEEEEEVAWAGLAALGREVLVITLRGPLQGSTIVRDYLDPEKLARLLPSAMEEQEEEEGESSSSAMEQEEEVGTDDEDKSFSRNTTRPRYDSHGSSVMKKEGKKTLRGGAGGGSGSSKSRGGGLSIYDCLEKFVEREKLASTETLYCPVCKEHLSPIKKMDVYTTPDVLILHLKRFLFVPGQYFVHRDKINDVVDFPITGLDLRKFVIGRGSERGSGSSSVEEQEDDSRYLYDLYAVSHHMGGLGGGHYTATAYNTEAKKWYYFNDSSVSETEPSSAVNGTAYVLFYRRRGAAMKWGGLLPSAEPLPDDPDDEQK
eukprot:scaffold1348_cov184-Ochromonas_danica.AAC.2